MIDRICSLIKMKKPANQAGLLFASGTVVPVEGTRGYQTGCIFQHTDGIAGDTVHINNGTYDECNFDNPEGGDTLTLAELADVADGFATRILETGTYSSEANDGVVLSTTNTRPFSLLYDDGGVTFVAGDVYRGMLTRILLSVDQDGQATINAVRGQIKALDEVDITHADAVTAPMSGYLELAGTGGRTLAGHVACVRAALEEGASGETSIGEYLAGFEATLNSTRTYAGAGLSAAFLANISGGTSKWQYGLYVEGGSTTVGIQVGEDGVPAGDLIVYGNIAGSYLEYDESSNSCGRLNVANSTIRQSQLRTLNECSVAFRMYDDATHEGTSARSVLAETYLNAAVVVTGAGHHEINAINGETILQATSEINGAGLCISGVKGEIRGSGTQTECNFLTAVLAKYNNATELGTGDSALFLGWSHTGVVDYGLKLKLDGAGSITTGIDVGACTTTGINIGVCATGILIDPDCTMGFDVQARSRVGTHNWGAASGIVPSVTGGILEVAGSIATDIAAGAYSCAFNIMAITSSITGDVSAFGSWHELNVIGDLTIAQSNYAATWSMINLADAGGALTFNASGIQPAAEATWVAGHTIVFKASDGVALGAGRQAAGLFVQGEIGDTPTVDSDAKLCGILVTVNSKAAAYMEPWPVGLEIADSASTTAIKIGTCTTGISISGTITNDAILVGTASVPLVYPLSTTQNTCVSIYADLTDPGTDKFFRGLYVRTRYMPSDTEGGASVYGIRGHVLTVATYDNVGVDENICGVHGYVTGTADSKLNDDGITVSGVRGELGGTGADWDVKIACAVEAKVCLTTKPGSTLNGYCGVSVYAPTDDSNPIDCAMYCWGYIQGGIDLRGCAGDSLDWVLGVSAADAAVTATGATPVHGTAGVKIAIKVDDTTYYLLASTVPTG